jgi:hypothetical protein
MAGKAAPVEEYLMAVGELVQKASASDIVLFNAFKLVSGTSLRIAKAIYYALESLPSREAMLRRVMQVSSDDEEKRLIELIIKSHRCVCKQRNELAHALALAEKKEPKGDLVRHILRDQHQPQKPVTKEYLGSLLGQSEQALNDVYSAWKDLCVRRSIPPTLSI